MIEEPTNCNYIETHNEVSLLFLSLLHNSTSKQGGIVGQKKTNIVLFHDGIEQEAYDYTTVHVLLIMVQLIIIGNTY